MITVRQQRMPGIDKPVAELAAHSRANTKLPNKELRKTKATRRPIQGGSRPRTRATGCNCARCSRSARHGISQRAEIVDLGLEAAALADRCLDRQLGHIGVQQSRLTTDGAGHLPGCGASAYTVDGDVAA